MTKTKAQLRAEAVERLTKLNEHGYWEFPVHVALCGRDVPDVDEERSIIADLLTDDCGPCYSCAKLAELRAENNALRVKVDEQRDRSDENATCNNSGVFVTDDSREKLEADVCAKLNDMARFSWRVDGIFRQVQGWLDRQAAITERNILTQPDERDEHIAELCEDVAERDDVIAVLKAENAELQAKVDELTAQLESAHAKNRSLRQHIAKMQEGRHGWHVKYPELEKKNAELQREVDRLTRENVSLARDLGECMAERDELIAEIDALEYEGELDEPRGAKVDINGEVVG